MSAAEASFRSAAFLFPGRAPALCRASVTIPARNEEKLLPRALEALRWQVDEQAKPLPPDSFEVIVLCNNCTDSSVEAATAWHQQHPEFRLHLVNRMLAREEAHAGTARKLLMDTACARLARPHGPVRAVLSTDADTEVAPDWIAQNLLALERGADAVGGQILIRDADLAVLPQQVRRAYVRDRRYAELVAEIECYVDPQPGDCWPRHLDHFGSSLACTPEAYQRAGGMPAVSALEDEAFVNRLRRACLHVRHEPAVRVYTSARLRGRTGLGLAKQFRCWAGMRSKAEHTVRSGRFVGHRFRVLRQLREVWRSKDASMLPPMPEEWYRWTLEVLSREGSLTDFFSGIDSDGLVAQGFEGAFEEPIVDAIASLERLLADLRRGVRKEEGGSTLSLAAD